MKMKMMPLISKYETLNKRIKVLKQWFRDTPESEDIKKIIRSLEKEKRKISASIHKEVEESMPLYCQILQVLGLKKSTELAILLTFIDLNYSRSEIWSYCKHSRRANEHLSRLANSIYVNMKKGDDKISERYRRFIELEKSGKLHRRQVLTRIKTQLIKDMRRVHLSLSSTNIKITTTNPRESTSHEL
ncbi:MAG: hypothetical protein N3G77_02285 [Nitrososphaeria archaeon]|nr:hypothetical protein [Nitrososphaeria archaeon]